MTKTINIHMLLKIASIWACLSVVRRPRKLVSVFVFPLLVLCALHRCAGILEWSGAGEHVLHGRCSEEEERRRRPRMYDNGYFIIFYPEIGYLLVLECVLCMLLSQLRLLSLDTYERGIQSLVLPARPHGVFKTFLSWLISRRNVHC